MKISALQKNLKRGLAIVGNVTSRSVNLPILNNVKLEARDKAINLIATNLEIGITHGLRGRVEEPGDAVIDAKLFLNYISLLPNKRVDIEQKERRFAINCENYKTTINSQSGEDYPLIPVIDGEWQISVNAEELKAALSQTVFAVSGNETRADLSGVLLFIEEGKLFLAATDSYRLAEKNIKILKNQMESGSANPRVLVPAKTIQELIRVLSGIGGNEDEMEGQKEVRLKIAENQIAFSLGTTELISRLIEGQFPDYRQVIPGNIKTSALIEKAEILRATKAAALFSQNSINDIYLTLSKKGKLIVESSSGQVGHNLVELETKIDGIENELALNYRYLLDGLLNVEGDYIRLEVVDKNSPCVLRPEKTNDYLYLIMPIKQ